tara:strand:- start:368 stop:586 length:219 start_codon:yes stop_codon:yes gene_type:complete
MAEEYKELVNLSQSDQEAILETMSDSYYPIQIDDRIYMIPEPVNNLIDRLVNQLEENGFQVTIGEIVGKKGN